MVGWHLDTKRVKPYKSIIVGCGTNIVLDAIIMIYNRGPLRFPKLFSVILDQNLKEDLNFNQFMLKHQVKIRQGTVNNHRSQGIVENYNKLLAERLCSYQYDKDFNLEGSRNTE